MSGRAALIGKSIEGLRLGVPRSFIETYPLPMGFNDARLPLALQIGAAHRAEPLIYQIGAAYEDATRLPDATSSVRLAV